MGFGFIFFSILLVPSRDKIRVALPRHPLADQGLSFDDEFPLHQRRMTRNGADDVILAGFRSSKRD
jgi:hypothetical protein